MRVFVCDVTLHQAEYSDDAHYKTDTVEFIKCNINLERSSQMERIPDLCLLSVGVLFFIDIFFFW